MTEEPDHWLLHDDPLNGGKLAWGTKRAAVQTRQLGFDIVVLMADTFQDNDGVIAASGVEIYRWPTIDDAWLGEQPFWRKGIQRQARTLAVLVTSGRNVLVTCAEGYNRSAVLAAATLHELTGWSGITVLHRIKSLRLEALFNDGFREWVLSWEGRVAHSL